MACLYMYIVCYMQSSLGWCQSFGEQMNRLGAAILFLGEKKQVLQGMTPPLLDLPITCLLL